MRIQTAISTAATFSHQTSTRILVEHTSVTTVWRPAFSHYRYAFTAAYTLVRSCASNETQAIVPPFTAAVGQQGNGTHVSEVFKHRIVTGTPTCDFQSL